MVHWTQKFGVVLIQQRASLLTTVYAFACADALQPVSLPVHLRLIARRRPVPRFRRLALLFVASGAGQLADGDIWDRRG